MGGFGLLFYGPVQHFWRASERAHTRITLSPTHAARHTRAAIGALIAAPSVGGHSRGE